MNPDTGEVAKFNSTEEAKKAGFTTPLSLKEFNKINNADRAINVKNVPRMKPGRNLPGSMSLRRIYLSIWGNKYKDSNHANTQAKDRRKRQIAKGILRAENGLVLS